MAEPITLDEAKLHLRVVGTDEDSYISALIVAARMAAEGRTQRTIVQADKVLKVQTFGDDITVPAMPVQSVGTITYTDTNGAAQTLPTTVYEVDSFVEPPVIRLKYGQVWPSAQPGSIRVPYTAGYPDAASVPQPLKQWMLLVIGTLFENRETVTISGRNVYAEIPETFMWLLWQPYQVYL